MRAGLLNLDQVAMFTRRSRHSARELYRLRKINPVACDRRRRLLFEFETLTPYIRPEGP